MNTQNFISSIDVVQLTLTLKLTAAQVVERLVIVNNNSSIQDYVHPDDHAQPTNYGLSHSLARVNFNHFQLVK